MKYILTLEKYQTYKDYEGGKWGSPEEMREDAKLTVKHTLPSWTDDWIESIEDQSVDDKGIKFEFKIGKDTVHALKNGKMRGEWELYLNRKKITNNKLRDYFDNTLMSPVERFLKYAGSYDFNAAYIDDGRQYKNAIANNAAIEKEFNELSSSDKKTAVKVMIKKNPKMKLEIEKVFQA